MLLGLLTWGAAFEHGSPKPVGSGVDPDDLLQLFLGTLMGFGLVPALGHVGVLNRASMKAPPASNAAMRELRAAFNIQTFVARISALVASWGGGASRRVFCAVIALHDCNRRAGSWREHWRSD